MGTSHYVETVNYECDYTNTNNIGHILTVQIQVNSVRLEWVARFKSLLIRTHIQISRHNGTKLDKNHGFTVCLFYFHVFTFLRKRRTLLFVCHLLLITQIPDDGCWPKPLLLLLKLVMRCKTGKNLWLCEAKQMTYVFWPEILASSYRSLVTDFSFYDRS